MMSLLLVLAVAGGAPAESRNKAAAALPTQPHASATARLLTHLNAAVAFDGVYDGSIGWHAMTTPMVRYTQSVRWSADVSLPIYPYLRVDQIDLQLMKEQLQPSYAELGDMQIGVHAGFYPRSLWQTVTASFTLPTGDRGNGLGTGKPTFDLSDLLERRIRHGSLLADVGVGDSAGLSNNLVPKDYSSVGGLAHFQGGISCELAGGAVAQLIGYEQLPFGSQKIYTISDSEYGYPKISANVSSVQITSDTRSEDNGLTLVGVIPVSDHLSLTSYYNRSLRHNLDTVSLGFVWVMRAQPRRMSLIDRALREAEAGH